MTEHQEIISEISLSVSLQYEGKRLDVFLSDSLAEFSRSYLKKLVVKGLITLNGEVPKPSKAVKSGDDIEIRIPVPELTTAEPEDIPINCVYEDDHVIVVNKAPGMVVHPAPGNPRGTLVNALLHHCRNGLSAINGVLRPGIVHRLDKNTSGLMVCAKTDTAMLSLTSQFAARTVSKRYTAIVHHWVLEKDMTIDLPLGRHRTDFRKMAVREDVGKNAITVIESQKTYGKISVVDIKLLTGRTHQIRVHLKHLNCPLICDDLYGRETVFPRERAILRRCALHSRKLEFEHPATNEPMSFETALPEDMAALISYLEQRD